MYCAPRRNYLINLKKGPNGTGSWKLILPRDPTGTGTYPPVLKNQFKKTVLRKLIPGRPQTVPALINYSRINKERPVVSLWGTVTVLFVPILGTVRCARALSGAIILQVLPPPK